MGGGGAVAVAVAGLTKRFFNHIQKDFLINDLNQDVRISIFNIIRTKMLGYLDVFGYVRMRSEASGCVRKHSKMFDFFFRFC